MCGIVQKRTAELPENELTPEKVRNNKRGENMNQFIWIGIIVWGALVMGFGFATVEPVVAVDPRMPAQDVLFLLTGGLLSCLIGMLGLCGLMGWLPWFREENQSAT
jgi:hypothetical protein